MQSKPQYRRATPLALTPTPSYRRSFSSPKYVFQFIYSRLPLPTFSNPADFRPVPRAGPGVFNYKGGGCKRFISGLYHPVVYQYCLHYRVNNEFVCLLYNPVSLFSHVCGPGLAGVRYISPRGYQKQLTRTTRIKKLGKFLLHSNLPSDQYTFTRHRTFLLFVIIVIIECQYAGFESI